MQALDKYFENFLMDQSFLLRFRKVVREHTEYSSFKEYLEDTNVREWVSKLYELTHPLKNEMLSNFLVDLDREWKELIPF